MNKKPFALFIFGAISQKWLYVSSYKLIDEIYAEINFRKNHPSFGNTRYQIRTIR